MAFADLLCHTVEVYRRSGDVDDLGQPVDANPSQMSGPPTATYPCRLNPKSGGLAMEERSLDVFVQRYTLYTEMVDIHEDDAVRVLDENGAELLPISKIYSTNVATGFGGSDHLEIELLSQTGPA
jgi:hypothetical protein